MSSPDPFTAAGGNPMGEHQGSSSQGPSAVKIILIIFAIVGVVGFLTCGALVALLLPAVNAARGAARNAMGSNQLKMVALAMHNYHADFGQLPAAYSVDEQGKPLLSWRVALLPYLDAAHVAQQIDPSKPWDAPENQIAQSLMPSSYRSPNATDSIGSGMSTIFVIQTSDSLFPPAAGGAPPTAHKFMDVKDGLSNTVMLVQLPNHGVPWMKPEDVTTDEVLKYAENMKGAQVVQLGMADGAVYIRKQLDPTNFKAMTTIEGNETITMAE